jgi:hypothetical protein
MDRIVKDRIKTFTEGLIKLSAETGVELNASGEIDMYCSKSGRYLAGLIVGHEAYEVWCFGDEPELSLSRQQENDDAP